MIKISELKEGDVLQSGAIELIVLQNLGKIVVVENGSRSFFYTEKELNNGDYKLIQPSTEKKYYMGFEVRKYPERPIVQVGSHKCLRRLIEVKENYVICENEAKGASPVNWDYVYSILETMIIEPSSGTREGDGC